MVKPTLLVLAAGMGSRYGSLKQMDGVGPNGEAIIDYSVYDAIRAGFGKVVFVIRHSFADDFCEVFNAERFGKMLSLHRQLVSGHFILADFSEQIVFTKSAETVADVSV